MICIVNNLSADDIRVLAEKMLKRGNRANNEILLTIDDGPHPESLKIILATLKKYKVPATFFVVGIRVKEHPDLVRQIMNTNISDLRKMGEEKYYNEEKKEYTVFIAYEIKKNAMLRFMKKQAKVDQTIDERQRAVIEKIVDEEIKKADEADEAGN